MTNVYQITTAQPEVEKIVTGNIDAETYDPDEEFTFTLEALGGAPMPEEGTETVNIKADEIGVFGEITYTEAGEYFYTITETEGDTEGMTYDTEPKTVKVVVEANEETGALSATVTYGNDEAEALTVTNVYRIVEVEIPVTKKVDGDTDAPSYDPDEEFTFTLEAQELRAVSDETPMPAEGGETVTIKADEIGTFGAITYYEPGTYAYIITETEGDTVGMSYDTTPTGVFVVVTEDEETGALNASVEALEYEITTITNTYKTGKLEVTKNVTVYGLNGEEDIASAINDKSFMVCVMDEDGNFYAMNGKNLGTDTYWVEITDGVTLTWEHMPFGTYTVIERENIAEETGYTLVTYYTVDAAEPAEGGAVADEPSVVPVDGTITEETPVASFTVENVYTPEKTFVKVVKVWVTSDTTTIPDSLTVYLNATAAGETEETAIILTADDDWTWMSDALPVYNADGQMIIYTWTEEDLPEGYSLTGMEETDLTEGLEGEEELTVIGKITTITNTYTPGMTSVQVTKIWDDADNRDGKRPENIKVQLYVQTPAAEEGAEPDEAAYGDPVTLPIIDGDEEKWTHIWTELPEMIDGVPQTYVVRELDVTEETDPETGEATGSLVLSGKDDATYYVTYKQTGSTWTVTNSYEPEETEVPVIKIWDDFDDADGKRPTSVTVFLYANGEPVARTELNKDNNWTYTFEHLNKYENGTEIEYYVEEYMGVVINEDYTEVEGSPAWNEEDAIWEITNKYEPKTEVTVTKVWNDADDKDGLRPDISVQLYRDGEAFGEAVELNEGNDWTANWSDLDKYWWKTEGEGESATKTATAYVYTVKEVVGEAEYEDGGRILVFGTEEDGLFYNVAIADNEDGTFTITNTYEPETVEIEIVKVWDDAEDQDGIRPDHIDVKLLADGEFVKTIRIEENSEGEWIWIENGLPKFADGKEIEYSFKEYKIEGYEVTIGKLEPQTAESETGEAEAIENAWTIEIKNTHEPEKTQVRVIKVWDDEDDQDGIRDDVTVTVTLYADGEVVEDYKEIPLTEDDGWMFETPAVDAEGALPKYKDGLEIRYTWTEKLEGEAAGEYESTVTVTLNSDGLEEPGSTTITNKHIPKTTKIEVEKAWKDDDDNDGKRPGSVTIELQANGTAVASVILSDENEWKYTFEDLPVYAEGEAIEYTLSELDLGDDYESVVGELNGDAENGYTVTITNSHENEEKQTQVTKIWDDSEYQETVRPDTVTLILLANNEVYESFEIGTETDAEVTTDRYTATFEVEDDDTWTLSVTDLPAYVDGVEQFYSWIEEIPEGYTISGYEVDGEATTITNTYDTERLCVAVFKVWDDDNDSAGFRPDEITVTLSAEVNGETINVTELTNAAGENFDDEYTLDESNNWSVMVTGLPRYLDGVEIAYSWTEAEIEGEKYAEPVYELDETGRLTTITNTYEPETIEITITKAWDDAEDQDGIRPDHIDVKLLANDEFLQTVRLEESEGYTAKVENLPKFAHGEAIEYSWAEYPIEGYELDEDATTAEQDDDGNWTISLVNTHEPEKTQVRVIKVWDDEDDQDGIRDDVTVTVTLYADGEVVEDYKEIPLTEDDGWMFETPAVDAEGALPKYKDGLEIRYTWTEKLEGEAAGEYESTVTVTLNSDGLEVPGSTTITNKHIPETIAIEVVKVWEDNDNNDGKRPGSIKVFLKADGEPVDHAILSEESGWYARFEDLPKNEAGKAIEYSLEEVDLDEYEYESKIKFEQDEEGNYFFTVTNTYEDKTTTATVVKVWNDNDDAAGKRADTEITVTLLANNMGVAGYNEIKLPYDGDDENITYTEDGNTWTLTVENLPLYVDGELQTYSWIETIGEDAEYTMTDIGTVVGEEGITTTITNTYDTDRYCLEVLKVWDDDNDSAGFRPEAITVTLMKLVDDEPVEFGENELLDANGSPIETEYTLNEENHWTVMVKGVPKNDFEYVWVEDETVLTIEKDGKVVAEYTAQSETVGTITYLTNSYEPETVEIEIVKVWDDAEDQDGIRPDHIDVKLLADGEFVKTIRIEENSEGEWIWIENGLPKFADGKEIEYSFKEYKIEGYEVTIGKLEPQTAESETGEAEAIENAWTIEIKNTHEPEKTQVRVIKVWDDEDDQDGIRDDVTVTVTLYADGEVVEDYKEIPLTEDDGWMFETPAVDAEGALPKYKDGLEIRYTWTEKLEGEAAGEYESTVTVTLNSDGLEEPGSTTITNKHIPETTGIEITKEWDDDGNNDDYRPTAAEYAQSVHLLADGTEVEAVAPITKTVTDNGDNTYTVTFEGMPKYKEGTEIAYTVKEDKIDAYTAKDGKDEAADGETITNTHEPDLTETKVTKIWDDSEYQEIERPKSVKMILLANNVEYATFDIGPNYEDEKTDAYETAFTMEDDDTWTLEVTNLPKYDAGVELTYSWVEVIPEGYTISEYEVKTTGETTITNTYDSERFCLTVLKVWDDANDQDGLRPEKLTVGLFKVDKDALTPKAAGETTDDLVLVRDENGKAYVFELSAENNWSALAMGLPIYENGEPIEYYWVEELGDVYELEDGTYEEDFGWILPADLETRITTLKNTYEPETTEIAVEKAWDDNDDQDGIRPDEITVYLLADGKPVDKVTLSDEIGWTYLFEDLPVYKTETNEDGTKTTTEIEYTFDEVKVPGYESEVGKIELVEVDGEEIAKITITNKHEPETVEVTVLKVWDDAEDQDGIRPDEITVYLLVSGEKLGLVPDDMAAAEPEYLSVTLSEDNNWTAGIDELPKYENGELVKYSWSEEDVPEGYELVSTETEGYLTTITNKHEPVTIQIEIRKAWDDAEDQDGIRPDHIDVKLLADDEFVKTIRIEPNSEGKWIWIENGLAKYAEGKEIKYTFKEYEIEGYELANEPELKETEENVWEIEFENKHEPEKIDIAVEKFWHDEDDQDGIRPGNITVKLLADGTKVDEITLDEDNGWTYLFEGLDANKVVDGKSTAIKYTVEEFEVEGYETEIGDIYAIEVDGETIWKIDITNTHIPKTTDIEVKKVWVDADDQDGKRPGSITVVLKANDADAETVILSAENKWEWIWSGLPVNAAGEAITYTLEEIEVTDYDTEIEMTGDAENGYSFTVTNTHKTELTEVEVEKTWDDDDDRDGKRPAKVTMVLYKNNVATETKVELTKDNGWKARLEKLDKYENGDEIVYFFMEEAVEDYSISEYTIDGSKTSVENTYTPGRFCLTVLKVWDDANDQDGLRPDSVTVRLFANASAAKFADGTVVPDVVLNEGNHWTGMVMGLPIMAGGEAIEYTWYEVSVPEGYTIEENQVKVDTATRITSITNIHTPEETQVTVKKVWADEDDQDGIRAAAVTVELLANGVPTAEAVLNEGNTWSYTFEKLPVKEDGADITYTVREINAPEGYTVEVNGDAESGFVVTNTHEPETVEVTVLKVWDDNEDQDGIRPKAITVKLTGGDIEKTVQLTAADGWTATVKDLPKFKAGEEITYTWTEDDAKDYDYELTSVETTGYVTTLTNTHEPEETVTTVKKVWDDNDNKHGKRPESIVVVLKADDVAIGTETLSEANGWTATREHLPLKKAGKAIVYSWEEAAVPAGYTMNLSIEGDVTTITNTYRVGKLVITKTFSDNVADKDELDSLEFTVTGPDDYKLELNYSQFTDGKFEIKDLVPGLYAVTEENAFGLITNYTLNVNDSEISGSATVTADATATIELKNSYDEDLGDLVIAKEWCFSPNTAVDMEETKNLKVTVTNSDGKYVNADGTFSDEKVELTISDGKRLVIRNLPIDTYTVTETNHEGLISTYHFTTGTTSGSADVVKDAEVTVVLKNNYEQDLGSLVLKKTWTITGVTEVPESAKSGLRFVITSEDARDFETITVYYAQFAGEDSYTVKDLPVGTYTVKEYDHDTLLASYGYEFTGGITEGEATLTRDAEVEVPLENEYKEKLGGLTIVKTFTGAPEDADLSELSFVISGPNGYTRGVKYSEFVSGAFHIDDLPEGTYTVVEQGAETLIDHYHLVVTPGKQTAEVTKNTAASVEFENKYEPDEGALTIYKVFGGNPEDADLSGLTFKVTGPDGYELTLTYDQFTDGAYTVSPLTPGTYKVTETNADTLIADYTLLTSSVTEAETEVHLNETASVLLLNLYEQDKGEIEIVKTFTGTDEIDESVKGSLTFRIVGPNGFNRTVTYAEFTDGKYTVKDVPVGIYVVMETNAGTLIANYTLESDSMTRVRAEVTKGETVTAELTNIYTKDLGSLKIEKTFSGLNPSDNVDGLVFRVIGPENFDKTVYYSEFEEDGTYTFPNIPVGKYLVYEMNANFLAANLTLLDTSVTMGYADVVKGETATVALVNNYDNANTSVMVAKIWNDMDDLDGSRPTSLLVTLWADGTEVTTRELSEANNWTVEIDGLPMYDGTKLIEYSWTEEFVTGYLMTDQLVLGNVTVFTNMHMPELVNVRVQKIWDDNNNEYRRRPVSIVMTLSNGMTVVLNEANNWTEVIEGLPKFDGEDEIVYTWTEGEALGYTQTSVVVNGDTTTFTNRFRRRVPETPIEEYETPLAVEVIINHVGDCFD